MYYIYGISGPSLLIESTDSMIYICIYIYIYLSDRGYVHVHVGSWYRNVCTQCDHVFVLFAYIQRTCNVCKPQ